MFESQFAIMHKRWWNVRKLNNWQTIQQASNRTHIPWWFFVCHIAAGAEKFNSLFAWQSIVSSPSSGKFQFFILKKVGICVSHWNLPFVHALLFSASNRKWNWLQLTAVESAKCRLVVSTDVHKLLVENGTSQLLFHCARRIRQYSRDDEVFLGLLFLHHKNSSELKRRSQLNSILNFNRLLTFKSSFVSFLSTVHTFIILYTLLTLLKFKNSWNKRPKRATRQRPPIWRRWTSDWHIRLTANWWLEELDCWRKYSTALRWYCSLVGRARLDVGWLWRED